VTSPKEQAKGVSKKNLLSHGLGEVEIVIELDDPNITEEHMKKIQDNVKLSTDKIRSLYSAYAKSDKKGIKTPEKLTEILEDCKLFESCMLKWNGNDPTASDKWSLLRSDKDFMNVLMRTLFNAFDVDGDGSISFEELCASIFYLLDGDNTDNLRLRFRSIDLDRSGFIDMKEAKELGGRTMAIIRAGFMVGLHSQKYELIKAGLKESDFIPIVDAIGDAFKKNNFEEKEAKLLFKYADKNNDEKISEEEYIAWMCDPVAKVNRQKEVDKLMEPVLVSIQENVQACL